MNSTAETIKNSLSILSEGRDAYNNAPVVIHYDNYNSLRRAREIYNYEAQNSLLAILKNLKIVPFETHFEEINIIKSSFYFKNHVLAIDQMIIECSNMGDLQASIQELDKLSKEIEKYLPMFWQAN